MAHIVNRTASHIPRFIVIRTLDRLDKPQHGHWHSFCNVNAQRIIFLSKFKIRVWAAEFAFSDSLSLSLLLSKIFKNKYSIEILVFSVRTFTTAISNVRVWARSLVPARTDTHTLTQHTAHSTRIPKKDSSSRLQNQFTATNKPCKRRLDF